MEAGFTDFCTCRSFPYASRLCLSTAGFAWLSATSLAPAFPSAGSASLLRHSIIHTVSTGISTCCPSTTPLGLALGPDLPRADEPSPGNLGQSVCQILTDISLLTPAFSLLIAPALLTVHLQCGLERSPTTVYFYTIHSFGILLSPGKFSAQGHSTSELLRTL